MTIKIYSTLAGARRAAPEGPILRILNNPANDDAFVAGIAGSTSLMAVDPSNGRADGVISMLDLMAGAALPHGSAGAVAVLGLADELRVANSADGDFRQAARLAAKGLGEASVADNLTDRRGGMVKAAAALIIGIELIDAEIAS